MGVEDRQGSVFLHHVTQNCEQDGVFEDVGVVSGVEGVAITKHLWMVTASASHGRSRVPAENCRPPAIWQKTRNWLFSPKYPIIAGFAALLWLRGEDFIPTSEIPIRGTPTVEKSPPNPPLKEKTHVNFQRKIR
jgi:hypothetical protein